MVEPIVFTLPLLLPTPNRTRGEHWAATHKRKKRLAEEVAVALGFRRPPEPLTKARVTVWRHSVSAMDFDNNVASLKPLLDVMQPPTVRRKYGLGLIADDGPETIDVAVHWLKSATRRDQRTVVKVEAA